MLRYLNGGESHGKGLIAVLEGMLAGLPLTVDDIDRDLSRRQKGYGRGGRMRIEHDRVEFLSGVTKGKTLGTPITLLVKNRDWENWKDIMAPEPGPPVLEKVVTCPRPGHADLVGAIKYNHRDIRNVLEKASARETAIRVAVGGVAKRLKWWNEFAKPSTKVIRLAGSSKWWSPIRRWGWAVMPSGIAVSMPAWPWR